MNTIVSMALAAVLVSFGTIAPALGQRLQGDSKEYESPLGFKASYAGDWVVDDSKVNGMYRTEPMSIILFCSQQEALPAIGGKFSCEDAFEGVYVFHLENLEARSAFSSLDGTQNITIDDVFAYTIQLARDVGYEDSADDFRIVNQTDTMVNMTTTATTAQGTDVNQTRQIPARLYEFTYRPGFSVDEIRAFQLIALNGTTAFTVNYEGAEELIPAGKLPADVKVIFDSFELVPPTAEDTVVFPRALPDTGDDGRVSGEAPDYIANLTEGVQDFFGDG